MKSNLLLSTALALVVGVAAAGAQTSPTEQTKRDQANGHDRNGNPVRVIDTKRPNDNTQAQTPSAGNATTTTSGSAAATTPAPGSQSTPPANQPAASTATQPSTAQSGQASPSTQPSTAQSPAPSKTNNATTDAKPGTNQPAAAQTTQPAPQQPTAASSATPAQQNAPAANQAATGNTQAPVKLSASLQAEQKSKLTQAFTKVDMKPVTNVNFSLTVGTTVPRTVEFRPLPPTVVAIIPQYRGYNYILVRDEIVILEPGTSRIVDVIERGGPSQARTTTTTSKSSVNLSKQQRDYIRERSTRRTTTTTTGVAPRTTTTTRRVMVGDSVPDTVEIEAFPEEVYREVPTVRSYRYIRGDRGIYLVDPQRRVVIEDLDD